MTAEDGEAKAAAEVHHCQGIVFSYILVETEGWVRLVNDPGRFQVLRSASKNRCIVTGMSTLAIERFWASVGGQ